jgi:hypothetical protein
MLWVPADRLLEVTAHHPNPTRALEGRACERTYREVRNGRRQFVSLRAADGLLTALDLNHFWHIPKENGGLADIYVDGAQYGKPRMASFTPRSTSVRYQTDEERIEARRRSWREHKQRVRGWEAA